VDIDINNLRGISTILVMVAFFTVFFWAYSSKRKSEFDEAANLPFADEHLDVNASKTKEDAKSE